jgi:glycosyltransferase involved in cell wall biosynthesis
MKKNYLISIITVVLNDKDGLEKTIKSVINQTYKNFEYIIIDGGSTDGTIDIIKKYEKHIDYWISKPDKGIYDAMNKGAKKAKGEYLYFLNADDYLIDKNTLEKVSYLCEDYDFVYGNIIGYKDGKKRKFGKKIIKKKLKEGYRICHQALFVKKRGFDKIRGFDTQYSLASDLDFIINMYQEGFKGKYFNIDICFYSFEGKTSKNKNLLRKEMEEILYNHYGIYYYRKFKFKKKIEDILKKIGMMKVYDYFNQRKNLR